MNGVRPAGRGWRRGRLAWAALAGVVVLATGGPALADPQSEFERACKNTTMARLRLGAEAVKVMPDLESGSDRPLTLKWFAAGRSQGICQLRNGRLEWQLDRKGRTIDVESACKSEVARLVRKRPRDVDIVEVEPRGGGSALRWMTYQGQTGTCWSTAERIDRVEED